MTAAASARPSLAVVIRATTIDGVSVFRPASKAPLLTPEHGLFDPGVPWYGCLSLQEAWAWFPLPSPSAPSLRTADRVRWHLIVCHATHVRRDTGIKFEARVHGPALVVWSGALDGLRHIARPRPLTTAARRDKAWSRIRRFALRRAGERP